jgi:hypothetical protein
MKKYRFFSSCRGMSYYFLVLISGIILLLACSGPDSGQAKISSISNGLVKVVLNRESGQYSFIDLVGEDTLIKSAGFQCITDQEYLRGRDRLKFFRPAGDVPGNTYCTSDPGRLNHISRGTVVSNLGEGTSISMVSTMEGKNVLQANFTLYPDQPFIDISWGFKNLTGKPVQVHRADLLYGAEAFPSGCPSDNYFMLDGNGGGPHNSVRTKGDLLSYNNLLLCRRTDKLTQSIVLGGMTYEEYVKFAEVTDGDPKILALYAEDPVGKRVDSGETYLSPDRFYLEYSTPNPFESLELYGETLHRAQGVDLDYYTFPSVCMWFLSVQHFGGDMNATNDTPGAVREMEHVENSGFLKYSPVCIRLVPDNYEQNNEQGWWDDQHWQMYGRKERCIVEGGHYKEPYETTEKWAQAILDLGGIPITYIQPGVRSEDYADTFPDHMLFNDPHRCILREGECVTDPHQIMGKIYEKLYQESYDYTDSGFVNHVKEVYRNLRKGGVKGSFYDYPERAYPILGGMEDPYATAASHYRGVFRLANEGFGKPNYIQERNIGMGSDITLGLVTSQRTQGDNNILRPEAVRSAGLRWYKNRSVIQYDMDGKALLVKGSRQDIPITRKERRAILTMSYTVSGRLLLTESFSRFNREVLYDLSRIFPFHSSTLSPRPVDAFVHEIPNLYDFAISPAWHQVVLYNNDEKSKDIEIPLSGDLVEGALGLSSAKQYYLYDFWNDRLAGLYDGSARVSQILEGGEARVISIHEKVNHPQFISTSRHMMQGYMDLVEKPVWNEKNTELSGTSAVIAGEPYSIIIALNGYTTTVATAEYAECNVEPLEYDDPLARLTIRSGQTGNISWRVKFNKH